MVKQFYCRSVSVCMMALLCLSSVGVVWAEEEPEVSVTIMPVRYIFVEGDENKFKALNWAGDQYSGGLKELLYEYQKDDLNVSLEGRAIANENDNKLHLLLDKDEVGFFDFDFETFRKYYDDTGGTYGLFNANKVNSLGKDLDMDIGHLLVELGTPADDIRGLGFSFERHVKKGEKSRLTWTQVREGTVNKYIGPSYQNLDEETNTFTVKGRTDVAGIELSGDSSLEMFKANSFRKETNLPAQSGSNGKQRDQYQKPVTKKFASNLYAKNWFNDDKSYAALGYRFQKLDNKEFEDIAERDYLGNYACYSSCKMRIGASAVNDLDSHTWVGHYMTNLSDHFSVISKLKGEVWQKESASDYPIDSDGNLIVNNTDKSTAESDANSLGQNISLRYSGLPNTNVYLDGDFEQTRNWLAEELYNAGSSSENFFRETVASIRKTTVTLGARTTPTPKLNFTTQFRQKWEDNDYDDVAETSAGGSARSAFINQLKVLRSEVNSTVSYKLLDWLKTAFRHQFFVDEYFTRTDAGNGTVETKTDSHVFTFDFIMQPLDQWLVNLSYSFQDMKTATPAAKSASATVPGFNADVNSVLLGTSYSPSEKLTYVATASYSWTRNFDNFTDVISGLPYGTDYNIADATIETNWKIKDGVTVAPHYGFYMYKANPLVEAQSDYTAHVTWVDVTFDW